MAREVPVNRNDGDVSSRIEIGNFKRLNDLFDLQCGKPMQQSNCKTCGAIIGGTNHHPQAGNVLISR